MLRKDHFLSHIIYNRNCSHCIRTQCLCICVPSLLRSPLRLDSVETRFQETAEAFEQFRQLTKKSKSDFETIKKLRFVVVIEDCYFIGVFFLFVFGFGGFVILL